ncbi:MAG: hypothetical protein ACI978_000695 [Oleispira sp.]|jgi:hypothetical protein
MTLQGINRYQAFAIHLVMSLIIFLGLLICITQYWYPGILFDTGNGWKAIALIVGIDLTLGPLLTLIIFNPKKSSLKFDLWVIVLVQTAALIYGTLTIHSSRPLAIAYVNKSFITFYANAENAREVQEIISILKTQQLFYVFNDTQQSKTLNTKQLTPYALYAKTVANISSAYHQPSSTDNVIWVQIDPLVSNNRYLKIDKETGIIIGFSTQVK